MAKNIKLKIGIAGCGAIGGSLAKQIVSRAFSDTARLSALYDICRDKSEALSKKISKNTKFCVDSLDQLIDRSELVIEASAAGASWGIARKTLLRGRKIMVMSVGGIVGHLNELSELARKQKGQAYFPSGAVCGIDGLKAAGAAGIKKVTLTTRKHPNAFAGVKYVVDKFNLKGLKKDKLLFSGPAARAVKYFPQNVNVAAVLGLAGIGVKKTLVRIIASPTVHKNIHEVAIESAAANIFTRTENILHPQNPKTSYLAVLSAVATLKQILEPVKIGT